MNAGKKGRAHSLRIRLGLSHHIRGNASVFHTASVKLTSLSRAYMYRSKRAGQS
ncbi:hypothetical protein FIBSPDRAFT_867916 [Athelia psychrophila]|uniref:Uncharacterized protein n=1 Tax=Athelia psychrophila TaxID=1759441 RepID=A0A166DJM9_9AGAM|nr:hypothetical protein FIBSPDRAFT_867916 [Fibularhizoctonia sp. CBS 109695]